MAELANVDDMFERYETPAIEHLRVQGAPIPPSSDPIAWFEAHEFHQWADAAERTDLDWLAYHTIGGAVVTRASLQNPSGMGLGLIIIQAAQFAEYATAFRIHSEAEKATGKIDDFSAMRAVIEGVQIRKGRQKGADKARKKPEEVRKILEIGAGLKDQGVANHKLVSGVFDNLPRGTSSSRQTIRNILQEKGIYEKGKR